MYTILLQVATGLNVNHMIETLTNQGPCVALLIIAVLYLTRLCRIQSVAIEALNAKVEKYMVEDHARMIAALENNTEALKDLLNSRK